MDVAVHSLGDSFVGPYIQQHPAFSVINLNLGFQAMKFQYGSLQGDEVVRTPWAVHYRDAIDLMPVYDMEFAFPIDINHPVLAIKAIYACVKVTRHYSLNG